MSTLIITFGRDDDKGTARLIVAGPGIPSTFASLDPVDEFLLADVLRHVDRIAFGESPGPCERWLARTEQEDGAA